MPNLRAMLVALGHRGPDGQGEYVAPGGACIFGHTRLAIIDVSDSSSQPYVSPDRNHALVYNGECYNYMQIRAQLKSQGHVFDSEGDTEVVFKTLLASGVEGLAAANAMFAIGYWDENRETLLLARDFYGQKPLYYAVTDNHLIFASEVRAMLASGLVARKASPEAIASFLSYGCVQPPQTIVDSVLSLNAGSHAHFSQSQGLTFGRWSDLLPPAAQGHLRDSFVQAVKAHLISDVPIGIFLSGGIDSSAVLAAARQATTGELVTLSISFPDNPEYSESKYARQMADRCGSRHHDVPLSSADLLALLPAATAAMDQPTVDGINTFAVARAARNAGLTVALSGIGGDELFGGYTSFRDVPAALRYRRLSMLPNNIASSLLYGLDPTSRRSAKICELLDAPSDVAALWLARRRIFSSRQLGSLLGSGKHGAWQSGMDSERLDDLRTAATCSEVGDAISQLELKGYMEPMLLRDSDYMGMANSLEIRAPFLDINFSRQSLEIAAGKRLARTTPKQYFVEQLAEWLPKEVTDRPKQGFVLPLERWMLGSLRQSVDQAIGNLTSSCSLINPEVALRYWVEFQKRPQAVGWVRPWSLYVLSNYLTTHQLSVENSRIQPVANNSGTQPTGNRR